MQQTNRQSSEPTENTVSVDTASHLYAVHAMDGCMSQKTARSEARSEAQTQLFSNLPTCPQEIPLPSGSTAEPFGCHNIFRKAVFPLWPIVFFVTCHNSLPPPPHPHPLSGAQIRSITALVLWGDEPFLLAVDGSPADDAIATYTVGRLGAISPPHRDALQHRGLCPAHLRRLLCDVILTTVLLHKRHAVPVLPLADHFSTLMRVPVN